MKTSLLTAAIALCASALFAQEPVSTGFIRQVVPRTGVLVIRSDQNHQDMTFFNADRATIFRADGKALTTADLQPGQRVTVKYGERNKKWYITQIILSEPRPGSDSVVANPAGRERIREATEGEARTPDAPPDPPSGPPPAVVK
jgi:hypothetical protein